MATIIGPVKASVTFDTSGAEKQLAELQRRVEKLPDASSPAGQQAARASVVQRRLQAPATRPDQAEGARAVSRRREVRETTALPRERQGGARIAKEASRGGATPQDQQMLRRFVLGIRAIQHPGLMMAQMGRARTSFATRLFLGQSTAFRVAAALAIAGASAKVVEVMGPAVGGFARRIGEEFGSGTITGFGEGAGDAQRVISRGFELVKTPLRVLQAANQGLDLASGRVIAGSSEAAATEDFGAFVRASTGQQYLEGMLERTRNRVTHEATGRIAADALLRVFDKVFTRP